MARRLPVLPTLVVLLAVAIMVSLGVWQLHRAEWKEALLARAAHNLLVPAVDLPARLPPGLDYRRFHVACERLVFGRDPRAGTGRGGMTGWLQTAGCLRGAGKAPVVIGLGITERPDPLDLRDAPHDFWGRILHTGTVRENDYVLYAERPLSGLIPVAQPTPDMANVTTPDGHRSYAMQWFLFAIAALTIYILAVRRRWAQGGPLRRNAAPDGDAAP